MKKKKTWGVILFVIGVMAAFGMLVNGTLANIGNENIITAVTTIILPLACLISGFFLVVKSKKQ